MPSRLTSNYVYWDANCFISWVEGHEGRRPALAAVLAEARAGGPKIVTSVLSYTEAAFIESERLQSVPNEVIERALDDILLDRSVVDLFECSVTIASRARQLVRAGLPVGQARIKPADAIHLATALAVGAAAFHTYDQALSQFSNALGLPIGEPQPQSPKLPLFD